MRKVEIRINNQYVDVDDSFEYRLDRFIQDDRDFVIKGGDTTTNIIFPNSKRNEKVFGVEYDLGTIDKFNRAYNYIGEIIIDGDVIMIGELKIDQITKYSYTGSFVGENVKWISDAQSKNLNEIGLDENKLPTWTVPFSGGDDINTYNELSSSEIDICFPTIVYNNTPITDRLDYTPTEIFGTYDNQGEQLVEPLDFPNIFPLKRGFFGLRQGLTFEDFPPAVYYKNLLIKAVNELGLRLTGEILEEDFFKKLVMPYVGSDPYNYNWKTLGYLFAELKYKTISTMFQNQLYGGVFDINEPRFSGSYNLFEAESLLDNPATESDFLRFFTCGNIITYDDNVANRIDAIGSFRPYLVDNGRGAYVCPADGRYNIRVKSRVSKTINIDNVGPNFYADRMFNRDTRWGEQILCIIRYDTDGEFVFTDELYRNVGRYIVGQSSLIDDTLGDITQPSDLIAWFSPKRYADDPQTGFGSPITSNESVVNITNSSYSESIVNGALTGRDLTSINEADINITLDLEKNERVAALWITLAQYEEGVDNILAPNTTNKYYNNISMDFNDVDSVFEVNYECGVEDLDIASNLPDMSISQFLGNFFNFFNLSFEANGSELRVFTQKSYLTDFTNAYDITDKVDIDSITITQPANYQSVTIGYDNDKKDKLLLLEGDDCINTTDEVINYANVNFENNRNVYAKDVLDVINGFSATKFSKGNIKLVDYSTMVIGREYSRNPSDLTELVEIGLTYGGTYKNYTYELPTIQSKESFEQNKLEELEYDYNYTPRIMYHLGTKNSIEGISDNFRFPINIPTFEMREESRFWIKPTVSSFDIENNNIYQTLRFDGINGIYNRYFNNVLENADRTYNLTCEAYLNSIDYKLLTGRRVIYMDGNVYKLLEIQGYDVNENVPCTLKLQKIV